MAVVVQHIVQWMFSSSAGRLEGIMLVLLSDMLLRDGESRTMAERVWYVQAGCTGMSKRTKCGTVTCAFEKLFQRDEELVDDKKIAVMYNRTDARSVKCFIGV